MSEDLSTKTLWSYTASNNIKRHSEHGTEISSAKVKLDRPIQNVD